MKVSKATASKILDIEIEAETPQRFFVCYEKGRLETSAVRYASISAAAFGAEHIVRTRPGAEVFIMAAVQFVALDDAPLKILDLE